MGSELSQGPNLGSTHYADSHPRGIAIRADKNCFPVRVAHATRYCLSVRCT
ncbi:hypothetical protein PQO01_18120 [Lentisphaera marina]|uniref:hypothetical protein n=1 Tax=Lentisphaera marina TaxID=1111041 RepID=UPI002365E148|nr:hypothetical protein [Lentisphaera marina]MDD7986868.1 hypothetical protein [Lentisphaera marina]